MNLPLSLKRLLTNLCKFSFVFLLLGNCLFGSAIFKASGDSMLPAFPDGCYVLIKQIKYEDIQIGMVIAYIPINAKKNEIVAHRVVFKDWRGRFFTKGDNCKHIDIYPVTPENLVGVVSIFGKY